MLLPIIVGRSSADEAYPVDLASLPHLFIAYSYPAQLQYLLNYLMATLASNNNASILFDVSFSRQMAETLDKNILPFIRNSFIVTDTDEANTGSKIDFLKSLNVEMKRRLKLLSSKNLKTFVSLTEISKKPLPYIIVCMEDVFSVAISNRKSSGLMFMQLILSGPSVGIHFIAATTGSYRNLLTQLVNVHPAVLKEVESKAGFQSSKVIPPLGAELVITPEELYFIKERGMCVHERLFKV